MHFCLLQMVLRHYLSFVSSEAAPVGVESTSLTICILWHTVCLPKLDLCSICENIFCMLFTFGKISQKLWIKVSIRNMYIFNICVTCSCLVWFTSLCPLWLLAQFTIQHIPWAQSWCCRSLDLAMTLSLTDKDLCYLVFFKMKVILVFLSLKVVLDRRVS